MKVTKDNRVLVYKAADGKLDVYININGAQYRSRVFPNIEEDLSIRSWGGNAYDNEEERKPYKPEPEEQEAPAKNPTEDYDDEV